MGSRIPLPPHLALRPFTSRAGGQAGLGRDRLRGPDLSRPYRGVLSPTPVTTLRQRCEAFQLRMPADAFFCSVTVALLMGVPLPSRLENSPLLHVAVPAPRRALAAAGIIGHKLQVRENQLRRFGGLRACSPELVWCQLASILSLPDLVAVGDYLIHHRSPRTTRAFLENAVREYRGRRGRALLRQALELLNDRSESRRESHLRVILVQANLTGLVANLDILTSGGWKYRGDLVFPKRKVIVEYQSDLHRDSARFRADMTRISRLEADGWFVVQVNLDDLRNPGELVQRIRRVLADRPIFH